MTKITLDQSTFKALAADTRVNILKKLNERRYTQSELASILSLKTPSIKEHLDALEKAGLVAKMEEGRKWKYYELTSKSRAILDPEQKTIWILLSLFGVGFIGILASWPKQILYTAMPMQEAVVGAKMEMMKAAPSIMQKTAETAHQITMQSEPFPYLFYFFLFWSVIFLLLALIFYFKEKLYCEKVVRKGHKS